MSRGSRSSPTSYVNGRWDRVEHFHQACYDSVAHPYGSPTEDTTRLPGRRAIAAS